ncbi:MAG TPA: TolC family protein, partial [Puia sp.]|nr:TolC family protein [Puia sp.]
MQFRKIWSAAAPVFLLLLDHSATAQNQTADSLISQISSGPAVTYSIQQCIDSALTNNANVKTAEFIARTAHNGYVQGIGNMLPSLSANLNFYNNGGKTVNPVTYQYVTENFNQGTGGIGGQLVLFNGFSLLNSLKQMSLAYQADMKDWQYQKDVITVTVIQDYFSILGTEEQLALAQKQAADYRRRTDLMAVQDSLGSIPPSQYTDQKAALASSELTIVNTKNLLEQAKAKLAMDMNIPYSPNMEVAQVNVDTNPTLYAASVDQVYQNARHHIAEIAAVDLHLKAAQKGVASTRGALSPQLTLLYGLNNNYSTASNVKFGTQFQNDYNYAFGLGMNIPILNGLRFRTAYKNAQVARDAALFNQKTINNSLRQAVESSYVNMVQNFRAYNVTSREVENFEESYREAAIRFDNGALSSIDYIIYNTNKNNAELSL